MYKRHMNKVKGSRYKGRRQGWVGWGDMGRGQWRHLYLDNNTKLKKILNPVSLF